MGFALSYEMRQKIAPAVRWVDDNRRTAILIGVVAALGLAYLVFFTRSAAGGDMVILYRPAPDRASIVFNLGHEYNVRTVRLVALDENGRERDTLWKFDVPGDAPKLSTFSFPPRGRGAPADNPPPALEPGRTYRLKVSAAGARGLTDFRLDPPREHGPG